METKPKFNWDDIIPVPQDDGPNPVAPIAYPPECNQNKMLSNPEFKYFLSDKVKMDIFRGVLRIGEHSLRALELTSELLEINAANYTVWYGKCNNRNILIN